MLLGLSVLTLGAQTVKPAESTGSGLGTREVFEGCTVDADGNIFEELKTEKYFVAALTPRIGVELFRHLRIGMHVRIPTDGEVTVGPSVSLTFGGGRKD